MSCRYYTYVTSAETTAVTICLRGPSKDIINEVYSLFHFTRFTTSIQWLHTKAGSGTRRESMLTFIRGFGILVLFDTFVLQVERNLQDAVHVVRNVLLNPRLVPGGGALEMALAQVCYPCHFDYTYLTEFH